MSSILILNLSHIKGEVVVISNRDLNICTAEQLSKMKDFWIQVVKLGKFLMQIFMHLVYISYISELQFWVVNYQDTNFKVNLHVFSF